MAMFVLSNAVSFYVSYLQDQALTARREEIYKLADMREIVANFGFASREMAHQVLATSSAELQEQQGDANDKHQRLLAIVKRFQQHSFRPEERQNINTLNQHVTLFSQNFSKVLALANANPLDDAAALKVVDDSEEDEDRLLDLTNTFMQQANAHITKLTNHLDWLHMMLVVCMLSFAGLGVLTCVVMARVLQGYMERIGRAVTQVQDNYAQVEQHVSEVTTTVQNEDGTFTTNVTNTWTVYPSKTWVETFPLDPAATGPLAQLHLAFQPIVSWREKRVVAYEGELLAGPRKGGGWRVRATFPVRPA
jgi:hypothetical protein